MPETGILQKKQASYAETEVEILHAISTQHNSWGLDEIRERDIRISDELLKVLSQWGLNQASGLPSEQQAQNATPDELQLIESFRKRGLIQ